MSRHVEPAGEHAARRRIGQQLTEMETHAASLRVAAAADELGIIDASLSLYQVCATQGPRRGRRVHR